MSGGDGVDVGALRADLGATARELNLEAVSVEEVADAARDALLARAESVDARFPTYYGAAWVALGRLELTTKLLGGCAS